MLQFIDQSVRDGVALRHALLSSNGTTAATAKRVLDAALAKSDNPIDVQRFATQVLIQDAVATRYWVDQPQPANRMVLFKELLGAVLKSPARVGVFSEAFETVDVSEALVSEFLGNQQLRLNQADQLAIIIGLNYATNEGTRTTGRKLLQRKLAELNSEAAVAEWVKQVADEPTLRQLHSLTCGDQQLQQFNRAFSAVTNADGPTCAAADAAFQARTDCHVPLASFIEDLGPAAVATAQDATEALSIYPWPVNAKEVAGTLAMMMSVAPARADAGPWSNVKASLGHGGTAAAKKTPGSAGTSPSGPSSAPQWAHMAFAEAVVAKHPDLDWTTVLESLDSSRCKIDNPMRVSVVLGAYRKATGQAPPLIPFLQPWKNAPESQFTILKFYASNPDIFDRTGLLELPPALHPTVAASQDYSVAWHSPSFVAALLDCAAVGGRPIETAVTQLVLAAAKIAPAAVTAAVVTANTTRSSRLQKMCTELLQSVGVAACLTAECVDFVFKHNRGPVLLRTLAQYVAADHGRAASVLPILQVNRLFARILSVATDPVVHVLFAISGQECGHVPTHYLSDALQASGTGTKNMPVNRVPLAMATVDVCDDLIAKGSTVSVAMRTALTAVANSGLAPIIPTVIQHARSLMSAASAFGGDDDGVDDDEIPQAIEEEGARIVELACKGLDGGDVGRLVRLKGSGNEKDRLLLRAVCRTVLDEATCVNQYPPSALNNFSRYFGQLVEGDLFTPKDLKLALRIVLQSVVSPSDPRMRDFGVQALSQFKTRLVEWASFRRSLRQAPDLDMYLPGIIAHLNAADREDQANGSTSPEPNGSSKAASPTGTGPNGQGGAIDNVPGLHQHDIRTLVSGQASQAPSSVVQDRINFLVGNTDTDAEKTEAHARELKSLLRPEYFQYFAEYLVVKRVALEPNNHRTYMGLIERLESADLESKIRRATIHACKRLFDSEKVCTNSSERSLLKSLGSWLGLITFAKNIPILARDLDLRDLIPKALKEGKLIAIVPFIAKLLEHTASSRAFRIPNPLIMGLLGQLAEMYHLDDLKITLRFEVEVLCRNLHVGIQDVYEFAQKERPQRDSLHALKEQCVDVHSSYDFRPTTEEHEAPRTKLTASAAPYEPKAGGNGDQMQRRSRGVPAIQLLVLNNLQPGREIANIPQQHHQQYRLMLQHAFDNGLQEAYPILDRNATVASITTREIIAKDFATDRSDTAMSNAGHVMARGLAANLVTVTARDAAYSLCRKHLGMQLPRVFTHETVNDVIDNLIQENATGIQQALEETTGELVAQKLEAELNRLADERHQAWRTGESSFPREHVSDATAAALASLPETLRPKNGLSQGHLAVYEAFQPPRPDSSVDHVMQLLQMIEEAALRHYMECPASANPAHILSLTSVSFTQSQQSEHHRTIKNTLVEVNQWITESNAVPLLVKLFPQIMPLAEKVQAEQRNPTNLHHVNLLLNEVVLFVLQTIREKGQGKAVSELTRLFMQHEKRWQCKELVANLIRLRVIDVAEFDKVLSRALQEPNKQHAVEFAGYIVQKCLIEGKHASMKDFRETLAVLEQIARESKRSRAPARVVVPTMHNAPYREEIEAYFLQWLCICDKTPAVQGPAYAAAKTAAMGMQQPQPAPQQQGDGAAAQPPQAPSKQVVALNFVKKLQDSGMLKADKMLDRFFGVLAELAVEDFATHMLLHDRTLTPEQRQQAASPRPEFSRGHVVPPSARMPSDPKFFQAVDAFSDLVVVLIKCCAWSSKRDDQRQQGAAESALITRVLHVVGKTLQFQHDWSVDRNAVDEDFRQQPALPEGAALQETFLQQPFMRFLSNLMIALAPAAQQEESRSEFFLILGNTLHSLNPQRLPGFAFAWIELVGHRLFIGKIMRSNETWSLYFKLLNDALRFVEPFARPGQMTPALVLYFKCVLKLMLLLLHDFSEFLLAYHQPLCDAIPPCCVQLRNIVLSAFPRQTKLPDPFARSGKYNQLPELREAPTLIAPVKNPFETKDADGTMRPLKFNNVPCPVSKAEFDQYIATKTPADFPRKLCGLLTPAPGQPLNVPLVSAMVLYAGIATIERQAPLIKEGFAKAAADNTTFNPDPITLNAEMPAAAILRALLASFGSEGRYHVVNACVNQLRFPNSHTHFFSLALQHLFAHECPHQEAVQEHITRVLVERLIISRPHPWGLLITFFDIVKDKANNFWEKPFIRCTPEIERMFESVAQSVQPQTQNAAAAAAAAGQTQAQQGQGQGQGSAPSQPNAPGQPQAPR